VWDSQKESALCLIVGDLLIANLVHQQSIVNDTAKIHTESAQLKYLGQRQISKDRDY
jgi:hypothetical protein